MLNMNQQTFVLKYEVCSKFMYIQLFDSLNEPEHMHMHIAYEIEIIWMNDV